MSEDRFDVCVIGGGPAGHAAALAAAKCGSSVVLVEGERLGGTCVHQSCIPTNGLLSALKSSLEAQELELVGILDAAGELALSQVRKRQLRLAEGMQRGLQASLTAAGVTVREGHAHLIDAQSVAVGNAETVHAGSIVIASGSSWVTPTLEGVDPSRVLTADLVQDLVRPPASARVLGGGLGETTFFVEYAFLLAALGTKVTVPLAQGALIPALDPDMDRLAVGVLENVGVVMDEISSGATDAEVVVITDCRAPRVEDLGLDSIGLPTARLWVDTHAETQVSHVFAAGDVVAGSDTTGMAQALAGIAGSNAAGLNRTFPDGPQPRILHTFPAIGWIGMGERAARQAGRDLVCGYADLSANGRAAALGSREGMVKVIGDAQTGEVLGVQAVSPDVEEIIALATLAIRSELTLDELALTPQWHPSIAEALSVAATAALRS
jgi:dihydrolipoamide dehydrogenase